MEIEDLDPWLGLGEEEPDPRRGLRARLRGAQERTWLLRGERVVELTLTTRAAMREAMLDLREGALLDQHTKVVLLQAETAELAQSFERARRVYRLNADQRFFCERVVGLCQELDRAGLVYAAWLARLADGSEKRER